MTRSFQRWLTEAPVTRERVDRLLAEHEVPIVDGRTVTFLHRAEADSVALRHWIFGLPSSQPLTRLPETDLWHLTIEVPEASRIEYKIERVRGETHELIMDPLNQRVAHDPFGTNSVCHGLGYETPDWTRPDEEARPGVIRPLALKSRVFGDARRLLVYLPARFRERRRYPLLIVHDGADYLRFSSLQTVLDNLIHRLEIPAMIVAFTLPGERLVEYGADPRHSQFLSEELVPELEDRFPLLQGAAARGLVGASFGAVAALSTAWRYPGFYGRLLLQSGSFAFSDIGRHQRGPAFDPVARFVNAFRENPGRPTEKLCVTCGQYESLIYENRSLVPVLQATGMELRYIESRDGHNWENWRDRMREGLSWLFPGPLWMVYE